MNHKSMLGAKFGERLRHQINQAFRGNAEHLCTRTSRIRQRSKKIEHRAHANLFPRGGGMPRCGMSGPGIQKADANLEDRPAVVFQRQINPHAQRFQHIGGPAPRM